MHDGLKRAWDEVVRPLLSRPKRFQVAALCTDGEGDDLRVLLITSRGTGRWILPKGWPIDGLNAPGAALREAWEEAGVKTAEAEAEAIGTYDYAKTLDNGAVVPVETHVFKASVVELSDDYPESDERTRRWVRPQEASEMVDEPGLRDILKNL
ncbi:MAG: NUDIX hydrolase [Sediminimonas sp.]|uniref:NUDIX hydrolase n=1 Tax=Sediminimonas sp. TaxID=2823379 RepID=UPI0028704D29|nr:NUDIX hydrolase [Sediminimonas sp.]MDR9485124.1 NUDIX hydrolase [Sediminimonas sp.]